MKFGEKVKKSRKNIGLSQEEFAKAIGVSLRTVTNYETAGVYPKKREVYSKMAEVLNVDINYLMTENEEFITEAANKYGLKGSKQAQKLIEEVSGLFSGGELAEDDMDIMMKAIQDAYWIAKEKNKKFTPKKYRSKE